MQEEISDRPNNCTASTTSPHRRSPIPSFKFPPENKGEGEASDCGTMERRASSEDFVLFLLCGSGATLQSMEDSRDRRLTKNALEKRNGLLVGQRESLNSSHLRIVVVTWQFLESKAFVPAVVRFNQMFSSRLRKDLFGYFSFSTCISGIARR
ncbi:hypothetical protein AVEN_202965-1 [Araneus ventricosus]|uniref:Uncharacterized protein n=1 Tax=Araneus ventricosus TaxID=182803 RepID=A0A4Y2FVF6_ARAVE|nr:hypothetical protein AVEN_202965-1 [Araneus ventricosus]